MGSTPGNTPNANTTVAPTAEQFLLDFPRFDTSAVTDPNAVQFSPDAIAFWLNFASLTLNAQRFGSLYYLTVELFVAHNLALEALSEQGGDQTIPGVTKGAIASSAA